MAPRTGDSTLYYSKNHNRENIKKVSRKYRDDNQSTYNDGEK